MIGRREKTGEHFYGGRLAGTIRAKKTEELPGRDSQVYRVNGHEIAEPAREICRRDRRGIHVGSI